MCQWIRHQAINWTNADLLSIGPLGTKFSGIQTKIQSFSFMEMHINMPSMKQETAAILSRGRDELQNTTLWNMEHPLPRDIHATM